MRFEKDRGAGIATTYGVSRVDILAPSPHAGAARAFLRRARGKRADVLLDKLGERFAFERASVALYDALNEKARARGTWSGGPSLELLDAFRQDEAAHVEMLADAIELLGGDLTTASPSAALVAVEAVGLPKVLADPLTTLPQCLHALLTAELIDNDGWQLLIELTLAFGVSTLANAFAEARSVEARHLDHVRVWLSNYALREAVTLERSVS